MRFIALLRKEIRECGPWVLFTSVFLLICGLLVLWMSVRPNTMEWRYQSLGSGSEVSSWALFEFPFIQPAGIFLFLFSIGLAIALGVRQYWVGFFTKTWGFLLHRSANRGQILTAKITAGFISFIPIVIVWGLFCLCASNKRYFPMPPSARVLAIGLIFIAFGFLVYLAVGLAGLSRAKWFTTKMLSLAFAAWIFFTLIMQWQLIWAWATICFCAVVLVVQMIDVFLNREFE